MGFKKGSKKPKNSGKKKGTPNKATANARDAIASFVEGNINRLNKWLEEIAADNPKEAFNCLMSVVEYHIPKLARQEVTGKDGEAIEIKDVSENDISIINQYMKEKKNEL